MFNINESSRISDLQLSDYSEFASQLPGRVTTRVTPTSTIMANLLSRAFGRPHWQHQIHCRCLLQEGDHTGRPYGRIQANLFIESILAAALAAPNPLSMFTTVTP